MEDEFLNKFRKEPRPEFSRSLYERIRDKGTQTMTSRTNRRFFANWKMALAGVAALLVLTLAVSPTARTLAQDFLNLFRVQRFAAVSVDPARIEQLQQGNVDLEALIGESAEVLKDPGEPQIVNSPEAASQLAGIPVRVPANLPDGFHLDEMRVQGEGSVRFKADTAKLQAVLDALGVTDVQIPPQLNGATVTVNKPPMVVMHYTRSETRSDNDVTFIQSRNPQIELPEGVNLPQLGEIALRVTGMAPDEARQFAQSVDWTSTLLVPVPANASSFREVEVRGVKGLLITTDGITVPTSRGPKSLPPGSVLLWAEGDMVYALRGGASSALVDIANSLQ